MTSAQIPSGGALPPSTPAPSTTPTATPGTPPVFTPPFQLGKGKPGVFTDPRQQIAGGNYGNTNAAAAPASSTPSASTIPSGGASAAAGDASGAPPKVNNPSAIGDATLNDTSNYPFSQQEQQANQAARAAGQPLPYPNAGG